MSSGYRIGKASLHHDTAFACAWLWGPTDMHWTWLLLQVLRAGLAASGQTRNYGIFSKITKKTKEAVDK